jgi:hypothetical protein
MNSSSRACFLFALSSLFATPAVSQGQVFAWGLNDEGQCNVPAPPPGRHFVELAGGFTFSVGRLDDGTLIAWGNPTPPPDLPPGLTYEEIDAQYYTTVARRSDGSIVAWGGAAPTLPTDPSYVQVATGFFHALAIRGDGSIGAWGSNFYGEIDVPPLPGGVIAVQVAGGINHSAALLSDGSVIAWGSNSYGQQGVPPLPPGVTYVELSANGYFTMARRSDGSVVAWGSNHAGQPDVPPLPPGLTYTGISAGTEHALALRSDGSLVAWGAPNQGQLDVPELPPGHRYVAFAGGQLHSLAIREGDFTCGSAENYCASSPNSTGHVARIGAWGSLAVADANTHLWTSACPPGSLGIFFYGADSVQIPFGNGTLCISPFYPGLFRLDPAVAIDAAGHAELELDFAALHPAGQIAAGSSWNFQFWFRDPFAGGAGTNLTDAQRVSFCP